MSDPVTSQQQIQEGSSSTVTVIETDDQRTTFTCIMLRYARRSFPLLQTYIKIEHSGTRSIRTDQLDTPENGPLNGVRIVDLTRIVAGPYCTMILGDLGAEVIKVEQPGFGDEARKWGPPFIRDTKEGCYFVSVNRNKKSICINLKSPEGKAIVYDLVKKSDVLLENYIPGKLDRLQLGYNDLKAIAPQLIYCSISAFGPDGPYSHKPGFDVIAASMGGLIHCTGPRNGEPVKVGVAVTDLVTGLYAYGAIIAALLHRTRTGRGQKVDCNLFSSQVASLINIGSNYLNGGKEATRWGTAHESIVPYEAFPTKNGFYTIGTGSEAQYQDLCRRLKREDLGKDERFSTNAKRVENRDVLIPIMKDIIKMKTNKEWMEAFEGAQFPNGPVNSIAETFSDEHLVKTGMVKTMKHPIAGDIKVVGPAVRFSDGGNYVRSPPPTLGQHTDEILSSILGYEKEYINKLKDLRVVQ